MILSDKDEINYYINLVNDRNISYRKLSELIKDNEYGRIDENLRKINQDKVIGIIICKQDNKFVIKYCSDNRILAREYELV